MAMARSRYVALHAVRGGAMGGETHTTLALNWPR
jgi:hypothetical protein